ncbi:hypothetical protein EA772_14160 [Pedobacter sp. G11]|uniref:hypothetical protein n=1 Tax=Pedobacter sp. G11 TaxID=2482728 RepID=UPI000F5EA64C|nr:hypothetical protein [Pedobacter sp. G11]AZI26422.1 hypothetical protein EA772_14160 [Pedobacter sp. G11]
MRAGKSININFSEDRRFFDERSNSKIAPSPEHSIEVWTLEIVHHSKFKPEYILTALKTKP